MKIKFPSTAKVKWYCSRCNMVIFYSSGFLEYLLGRVRCPSCHHKLRRVD